MIFHNSVSLGNGCVKFTSRPSKQGIRKDLVKTHRPPAVGRLAKPGWTPFGSIPFAKLFQIET